VETPHPQGDRLPGRRLRLPCRRQAHPIGKWGLDPTRSLRTLESYCILLSGIKLSLQLAGSIGLIATRRWGARLFLAAGAVTILQRLIIGDLPWQSVLFFAACGFVLYHHGKYKA